MFMRASDVLAQLAQLAHIKNDRLDTDALANGPGKRCAERLFRAENLPKTG